MSLSRFRFHINFPFLLSQVCLKECKSGKLIPCHQCWLGEDYDLVLCHVLSELLLCVEFSWSALRLLLLLSSLASGVFAGGMCDFGRIIVWFLGSCLFNSLLQLINFVSSSLHAFNPVLISFLNILLHPIIMRRWPVASICLNRAATVQLGATTVLIWVNTGQGVMPWLLGGRHLFFVIFVIN